MTIQQPVAEPAAAPATSPAGRRPATRRAARRRAALLAILLVLPYLVLFLAFRILPAIGGIALSVLDYGVMGTVSFAGLEHFARLVVDPLFWNALRVTVVYSLIAVPLVVVVSLAMAQMSARSVRGIKIYRAVFFLPVVTSLVTTAVIWQWLYSSSGPFNWILGQVGIAPLPWLSSGTAVLPSLALVAVWSRFGYDMLILLAGMLAIPKDYYEAASLDGANGWQQFRNITLPGLRRPLFFVLILEIVHSFQVFDLIYVMTGGGPVISSYSLVYLIYDQGFGYFHFGYASAAGVVLFVLTMIVSAAQRLYFKDSD